MKWRPIKTAPKDKLILLAQPPVNPIEYKWVVMVGRWIDVPHLNEVLECLRNKQPISSAAVLPGWLACYHGIMISTRGSGRDVKSYDERPLVMYPSHWMPIPDPPKGRFKQPNL